MSRTVNSLRPVAFIVIAAAAALAQPPQTKQDETITARKYWYYEKRGLLREVTATDGELVGLVFEYHGNQQFRVKRALLLDPDEKTLGYRDAMGDFISLAVNASGEEARNRADSQLQEMTGLQLRGAQWESWLTENREYLVWSDRLKRFAVDDEAKQHGTPTLEYRKRYPWVTRP